ncbi:MAG: archaeosortase A [Halodesulfurarchaeum sp.]
MSVLTDVLAWVVIAAFAGTAFLQTREGIDTKEIAAGSWVLFGVFWGALVPHFVFTQRSIIEGVLSIAAVPASFYVAYLIWTERRSFSTITRGVAIMGLIYLPFETIAVLQGAAIETVTYHVEYLLSVLGYDPPVIEGSEGLRSTFVFVGPDGHRFTTRVLLACTGIGSAATVSGLVMALDAPLRRRLSAIAIVVPIIYLLNVFRVTFIALAHGNQWFATWQEPIFLLFGTNDPNMVSFLVADRVLAQSLSVLVLIAITLGLLRLLPELSTVVEDVLFLVTGSEYDIRSQL